MKSINVLLVEDDEVDYYLTNVMLSNRESVQFNLDWVTNYDEALQRMSENRYDVYLLDYSLGIQTGLDLLKEAKEAACKGPIILLSGMAESSFVDIEAMKNGAADYLVKGQINADGLERAIRNAVSRDQE